MTLRLVTDQPRRDTHSVRADLGDLGELEFVCRRVLGPANVAMSELEAAIAKRDIDATIAGLRRLAAASELGRLSAIRLEGSSL